MNDSAEVYDRRSATRVKGKIPLTFHYETPGHDENTFHGFATNISDGGLSLTTSEQIAAKSILSLKIQLPETGEPFHAVGNVLQPGRKLEGGTFEYGITFESLPPDAQRMLSQWLAISFLQSSTIEDRRFKRTIESKLVTYKNCDGRTIFGFVDSLIESLPGDTPFLIISPGFGETKINALSLSYYLVTNGFRVLRYDPSNHTGESEGTIFDCTLSKLKSDFSASIDFAQEVFKPSKLGIIATSLSSLVAFKIASEDRRVGFVASLVPVVNLKHTLKAVYHEDLVGKHEAGHRYGTIDILGFPIDADGFLGDAVRNGFQSLASTKATIAKIDAPVFSLVGSNDAWVLLPEVKTAMVAADGYVRKQVVIESTMHQFHENPLSSKTALTELTKYALRFLKGEPDSRSVIVPRLREVAIQIRIEKERRKLSTLNTKENEISFWSAYLNRFQFICKVPDFNEFYSTIHKLMGELADGQIILDAGCGNGTYGLWLLKWYLNELQRIPKRASFPSCTYIGLDFVADALEEARRAHQSALKQIQDTKRSPQRLSFIYTLADLDKSLPFVNNYFDKICCNLVLSYVRKPREVLRELYRVLAPEGVLIVTSLKPYADLSAVYRSFLQTTDAPEEIEEARRLLANSGSIRAHESEGHFKFFSESELMGMMLELGSHNPCVMRSFANQANIAVIRKQ